MQLDAAKAFKTAPEDELRAHPHTGEPTVLTPVAIILPLTPGFPSGALKTGAPKAMLMREEHAIPKSRRDPDDTMHVGC